MFEFVTIFLRSGDCLVMTEESRFAIHSVARVTPDTCPQSLLDAFTDDANDTGEISRNSVETLLFKKFVSENRINFNVRQVC